MILIKHNKVDESFVKSDDEILQEFANSAVYQDKSRDEKVRLALFISYAEPNGLDSTFYGHQFNKLWDYWCERKWQFTKQTIKEQYSGNRITV
ncbi:MAG: hypothetical protein IPL84_03980 [Chitinophagaceae bacterium]|nr:hypothetical protein [Chitinophagaceae bacterium]